MVAGSSSDRGAPGDEEDDCPALDDVITGGPGAAGQDRGHRTQPGKQPSQQRGCGSQQQCGEVGVETNKIRYFGSLPSQHPPPPKKTKQLFFGKISENCMKKDLHANQKPSI